MCHPVISTRISIIFKHLGDIIQSTRTLFSVIWEAFSVCIGHIFNILTAQFFALNIWQHYTSNEFFAILRLNYSIYFKPTVSTPGVGASNGVLIPIHILKILGLIV